MGKNQPRLQLYTKPVFYLNALKFFLGAKFNGKIDELEEKVKNITGVKHAIATSMGRTAIYEGIRAACPKGGEVILSPITVPEVISMVLLAGCTPVFCDCAPGTWNLDCGKVKSLINKKTVAIMTTHFYGYTNTTEQIKDICKKHGIQFFEDAAQAFGSRYKDRYAGTIGDFGIYSFSYPKNLTSFYGGMLITNRDDIAEKARKNVKSYGKVNKIWLGKKVWSSFVKDVSTKTFLYNTIVAPVFRYGYRNDISLIRNFIEVHLPDKRLYEMPANYINSYSGFQADCILKRIDQAEQDTKHRIECARIYYEGLKDIKDIRIAPFHDDFSHGYLYYPVEVLKIDKMKLMKYLIENKHDVAYNHAPNTADLPAYREFYRDCPEARKMSMNTITLPTYPNYTFENVHRNVELIKKFFAKAK